MKLALTILQVIVSIGLIVSVLMQSGRSAGISGAIGGGAESIFGKKKGLDEFFAKITTVMAVVFLVLTLVLAVI